MRSGSETLLAGTPERLLVQRPRARPRPQELAAHTPGEVDPQDPEPGPCRVPVLSTRRIRVSAGGREKATSTAQSADARSAETSLNCDVVVGSHDDNAWHDIPYQLPDW